MDRIKKILLFAIVVLASSSVFGQVTWYLQAGGMWGSNGIDKENIFSWGKDVIMRDDDWNSRYCEEINKGYEIAAGLYMQIPVKADRLFIDTGLGWRMKGVVSVRDCYLPESEPMYEYPFDGNCKILNYQGRINFLELPIRFGYQLNLNKKNSFQFKLGPYVSYALGTLNKSTEAHYFLDGHRRPLPSESESLSPLSVGLSPSIMYKHRAFSIGATLNTPCFYNGLHDAKSTSFNLVIAVHLGSTSSWDLDAINDKLGSIADGLEAAGQVLDAVNNTYMQIQNYGDSESYESGSNSSGNTRVSGNSGSVSQNKYNTAEQRQRNQDRRTYENYDSQLSSHFAGNQKMTPSSVTAAQNKMKQLRKKWEDKGYSFPKSANEDK